ncbi:MAG: hypothetical protein QNJ97_17025 [Myxococcota bacterium]|nr:hypothetical protein [Myxococcota bacterium]
MSKPVALCVELKNNPEKTRYYKCTARTGREKGLTIQLDGTIGWCEISDVACELWVSDDQRLMVFRPSGGPDVYVSRANRKICLAEAQMATLLHLDELTINGRSYCIHVHGIAETIHPPRLVRVIRAASLAASLAIGASSVQCNDSSPSDTDAGAETSVTDQDTASEDDTSGTDTEVIILDTDIDAGFDGGPIETDDEPPIK